MCTPPVIQFTVQAFSGYLRNTEVTNFFNVQVGANAAEQKVARMKITAVKRIQNFVDGICWK